MRDLTDEERSILDRIFAEIPNIKDQLTEQLQEARVTQLDEEGSLHFFVSPPAFPSKIITDGVWATAIFDDIDGIPIYFLLHIKNGKLFELETYKADGTKIITKPTAEKLYF